MNIYTQLSSSSAIYRHDGYNISGEVLVGVYYTNGQLHIHVERARGLAAADSNGYSSPYIKTYLLPDEDKHTKQKTSVKKKTLDPVYNETLMVRF
jgi:synaptotagmin-like protein